MNALNVAWLTINRACNLRCRWCYANSSQFRNSDNMPTAIVNNAIKLFKDNVLASVILIGGEPTIHPNFFDILSKLRQNGITNRLVTNGLLFSDRNFLYESINAGLGMVAFSFKASNRASFKEVTGVDAFDRACNALENVVTNGVKHSFNLVACENFLTDLGEYIRIARELSVAGIFVDSGKPVIEGSKISTSGFASPSVMSKIIMEAYEELDSSKIPFTLKIPVPFCLFPKNFIEKCIERGNISTGCQLMYGTGLVIEPSGDLIPCNHLCGVSMGSIAGGEFDYNDFRSSREVDTFYQKVRVCPSVRCTTCEYWKLCGAGCRLYWLTNGASEMLCPQKGGGG